MPFSRRLSFFNNNNLLNVNKNPKIHLSDTLKQLESINKQRSNTVKNCNGHNRNFTNNVIKITNNDHHSCYDDHDNDDYDYDDDEDDLQTEKLFHTICGGNLSSEFLVPCAKNANWVRLEESIINLFKNDGKLIDGQLKQTHEDIVSLLDSNFGIFVFERLKSQVLPKAVRLLKSNIDHHDDDEDDVQCNSSGDNEYGKKNYLDTLGSVWKTFYHDILSTLECMLFSIESFNNVSIRKTTLVIFRDQILINSLLEDKLKELLIEQNRSIPANIIQMILIIQSVYERYPPSENKLQIEKIAALAITPYQGYYGTYENHNQTPIIRSKEPDNILLLPRGPFERLNGTNCNGVGGSGVNGGIYGHITTSTKATTTAKTIAKKTTTKSINNNHRPIMMMMNNNKNNRSRKISLPHLLTMTNNRNQNYVIGRINE
ncbi:uncharacterized protein LOC124493815 [Dermatophagoides farinae]|uniref:uncharacterized protein LOC124493815 n=1 Tax=Dermatophagoides farinae TaxID=6954 RepID=UPI003F5E4F13